MKLNSKHHSKLYTALTFISGQLFVERLSRKVDGTFRKLWSFVFEKNICEIYFISYHIFKTVSTLSVSVDAFESVQNPFEFWR